MNSSGHHHCNAALSGWDRWISRCIRTCLWLVLGAAAFLVNTGTTPEALAQQRAWLKVGGMIEGRMIGTTGDSLRFLPRSGSGPISLDDIRQVGFDTDRRLPAGPTPSGRLLLHGDESLSVQAIAADARHVKALLYGTHHLTIPRSAVQGILQPGGEQLRLQDDFESPRTIFQGGQVTADEHFAGSKALSISPGIPLPVCQPTTSISAGRLELEFLDSGIANPASEWSIVCEFGKAEEMITWTFHPAGPGDDYRCTVSEGHSLAGQPTQRSRGWHRLTLLFGPERNFAFVDERLVATCRGWDRPLSALRLKSNANAQTASETEIETASRSAAIDDVLLMERVDDKPVPDFDRAQDLIWMATGDELFGNVDAVDSNLVRFSGSFGRRRVGWPLCRGVVFRATEVPPGAPVRGLIATIDLAPFLGGSNDCGGRLYGAIESVDEISLKFRHPVLGTLNIPLGTITRIEPAFTGTLQMIDPATHHFGDEIREDFRMKLAEGTEREWKFEVKEAPKGGTVLTLLATDVEPGAPNAPKTGKYRAELERGGLRTELSLNGRSLGALNKHVLLKTITSNPERIRIPLPNGLLRPGENVLKLRQHPAKDDPDQFDDCEISRVAVAVEGE